MNIRPFKYTLFACAALLLSLRASADPLTDRLDQIKTNLISEFSVPLEQWRFHQPDVARREQPGFDDSTWTAVTNGFSWSGPDTKVWFRSTVTIPNTVAGQSIDGLPVRFDVGVDDDGEIYVNGQLKEAFHWDDGRYTLTKHAEPGQTFQLAVRGINGPGDGTLHFARLYVDVLPEFDQYLNEAKLISTLVDRVPAAQQAILTKALRASESEIHFTAVTIDDLPSIRDQLAKAHADLAPVAAVTRNYDVYYIGHAHIDMNWLWTWPETVDVCHRTWMSAMNLMDEFPDFRFVQSQPGAYSAMQTNDPTEFARMQFMVGTGHWDPVGGLWDESDSDIPSGEALARSFLLGQTYYKTYFGKYATTGWLPDSFGHNWQLPQIMQLVGIHNFYHMRCGNDMQQTWWEAPDGSRVLKANTSDYDANVDLSQLTEPFDNDRRFGLKQSLVVFGVGDHGGGPTREQILHIKAFQDDPLLPKVHFASADEYFDQLAQQPVTESLPIVDTDLQYTLEGCYTTHADSKKAIRSSENNLYSAEVLSSLGALLGQPYPVSAFSDAWKPTAFAQFHDIACGSAIHSTYDWIHEQLAPAFQFEKEQTDKMLNRLSADVDTQGGNEPIVVWNTLSSPRTDVVKVPMANADKYFSVTDAQGQKFPAQAMDGTNLVFVARNVPAFGYAVYYPSAQTCTFDGIALHDGNGSYTIHTPDYKLEIDKNTGVIYSLYLNSIQWEVFGDATDANALQLMEDSGNAWDLRYTGTNTTLLSDGLNVSVVDQGPVFVRLRVVHALGKSTYTQDLIAYGALPRIDIPTTINWQEEHETLKIRFPINAPHPEVRGQIPFGSIVRPGNGQECPGQKWMDISENVPVPVADAAPLDISAWFNTNSAENFDGGGIAYPPDLLPAAGVHKMGVHRVPFNLPGYVAKQADNIIAAGQELKLPANNGQDSLYLLAAAVNGARWTDIGFRLANGKIERRAVALNDWVVNEYADNELAISFPYRKTATGTDATSIPKMWIIRVPLPDSATNVILPRDPNVHIFAATMAMQPPPALQHGLSVLNDSKYGFDLTGNVFRLTALRSSSDPDPHPDQGLQTFTYSLYPHAGGWQEAHTEQQALALNLPLLAKVATSHPATAKIPLVSLNNIGGKGDLIATALKRSEDGNAYILRFYEANGQDTEAEIDLDQKVKAQATDILERPLANIPVAVHGKTITVPVGHNQIITLRITPDKS